MADRALPKETTAETVAATALTLLRPPPARVPVPLDQPPPARARSPPSRAPSPARVRAWFDGAAAAVIPDDEGALATARLAADACAGRATADNTRRPERAGVAPGATRALGRHGAAFLGL
jgi:hypothetical protein